MPVRHAVVPAGLREQRIPSRSRKRPIDRELGSNGGAYCELVAYAKFIRENVRPWDAPLPNNEGIHLRLVDFCYVLVRSVKTVLAEDAAKGFGGKSKQADDAADAEQALDAKKVKHFKALMVRKLGDNPLERR